MQKLLILSLLTGVQQNYIEVVKWYRLAAEGGNADAQFLLGGMYATGSGIPENYAESIRWLRLAAEQGNPNAQTLLGFSYWWGRGVPQNDIRAYVWFSVASALGEEEAGMHRDKIEERLSSAERATAQELATKCFESDFQDCPL